MVAVRVRGLNKVRAKGRIYFYHRKSGRRILADPGTPEFFAELAAAEASLKPAPKARPGTLGLVIDAYRASKFFTDRRPATRLSYDRAMLVLEPLRDMPLHAITGGFVAGVRDKLAQTRGRWITNYTLTVLGILCDFACEKEWMHVNPVQSVRRLPRHSDAPRANRPWRPEECRVVLETAPAYLRVPIALAMLAGFRRADVVTVAKTAIREGVIEVRTQKRGRFVRVPIHPELQRALVGAPAHGATTIAANSAGRPWSLSGFDTAFQRLIGALEKEGQVGKGLTLHGLRHTLATRLKEAGADDEGIADILGQKSLAMARHYSEGADTTEKARTLIEAADVFGNGKRTRFAKPPRKSAKPKTPARDK